MDKFCFITNDDKSFESNITEIDEWKFKWNNPIVTYKVLNGSRSFPNDTFEKKALTVALRQWGFRTKDVKFRRERTDKEADITLKFARKTDDKYFKDKPSVLAYAYFPTASKIGGDITFNDDYIWSTNGKAISGKKAKELGLADPRTNDNVSIRTYNIIHTLIHECGHAIGLKHQEKCNECVMFPYYNGKVILHDMGDRNYDVNGEPTEWAHDVDRIQTIYGKRSISRRVIDYFRARLLRNYT
jgi:hypothetical protein